MPRHPQRIDHLFGAYTRGMADISDARDHLARWLSGWTPDDVVADLTLVLSELVANAFNASSPDAPVLVRASCDGGVVKLEVANRVRPAARPTTGWRLDDPLRGGGRGLVIVKSIVDSLEVLSQGAWTVVRCHQRL